MLVTLRNHKTGAIQSMRQMHKSIAFGRLSEPSVQGIQVFTRNRPLVHPRRWRPKVCPCSWDFLKLQNSINLIWVFDCFDWIALSIRSQSNSSLKRSGVKCQFSGKTYLDISISIVSNFKHVIGAAWHPGVDISLPRYVGLEIRWAEAESRSLWLEEHES